MMQMTPENQMQLMSMLEEQARMMSQFMPGFMPVVSALSSTLATSLHPIEERTTLRAILGTSLESGVAVPWECKATP
jgi:hypothetical protein